MPAVHVVDYTPVSAERVLEAARDFSERRADLWPDVHLEHFQVHEMGEDFAEVTEGNPEVFGYIWERLRYDWSQPGLVKGTVVASNIFKPGSSWEIRATPQAECTRVEVIGVRQVRGLKGGIIWVLIRVGIGKATVAGHLRHFLSMVEESPSRAAPDRPERLP